ncbi:VOC family protein [bacterium]|nr:VOC family protein [bacterium]
MKFLHAMIRVKDINKSMDFYTKLLGMNLVRTVTLEDSILYFLSDQDGQTQIELTENFEIPENGYENGTAFGHFAFSTVSMDLFAEKMHKLGYQFLYEPFYLEEVHSKIAFIKDPDGNEIEIIED